MAATLNKTKVWKKENLEFLLSDGVGEIEWFLGQLICEVDRIEETLALASRDKSWDVDA